MGLSLKSYKKGKCSFSGTIFDKEGNEIHDTDEKIKRWKQYFEDLLNMEDNVINNIDDFLPEQASIIYSIFDEPFTEDEIIYALSHCSNNKAAGLDGLNIECSKVIVMISR